MARFPKTGMARRMRAYMREKKKSFRFTEVCDFLGIPRGADRANARSVFSDFLRRGEVHRKLAGRFRYNRGWQSKRKSPVKKRIYKAIYVSSRWAVSDIQRLTNQKDRSYIDRIVCQLKKGGWLQQVGRRPCIHGAGAETTWRIVNRERFRLEVME